jgi:SAM-dependent methyltransferase
MAGFEKERIEGFWNQVRKEAGEQEGAEELQTGYLGDEWPQVMSQNRFRGEWRQMLAWLARWQVPRGSMLDVGCGTGLWLEHFAGVFERAHGVDLSSEMVASAQARMARAGKSNATVEVRSVVDLPEGAKHDLIFLGGVLMYVRDEELDGVVARLARLVAPGGALVFRESTHRKTTWYREKPLNPGLFADPKAERPPYFAIYRPAEVYRELFAKHGLKVLHSEANRHYKLMDMTEGLMWGANRVLGGKLAQDRPRAEKWARRFYRHRWFWLWPQYWVVRTLAPSAWSINNHWFVTRPAAPAALSAPPAEPGARSS